MFKVELQAPNKRCLSGREVRAANARTTTVKKRARKISTQNLSFLYLHHYHSQVNCIYQAQLEKRTDSADTSVLVFRLSVIIFASRRMQAPFFCILHFMLFHTMLIGTCNIISIECDDIGRISIRTWRTFKCRQTD